MDIYGDHGLICIGGGDRISRHNSIRNKAFQFCQSAGLRPQLEKTALLKNGPNERLRPADIYIPSFKIGQQAALDLAVTSGLKK